MKNKNKLILFATTLLTFGTITMNATAAEVQVDEMKVITTDASTTTGTLGDNDGFLWSYDESTKTLTVTGTDTGLNAMRHSPFYDICKDVEQVVFQNCKFVGSIENLLSGLESLITVEFVNVDTTEVTNMAGVFVGCSSLENLDVKDFVTSKVTDMSNMFRECSNLSNLDVSGFDVSKVTDMSYMFLDCNNLTMIDVSDFDTSNVTSMRMLFSGCTNINKLDVSKFNTSKVTDMHSLFNDCENMESLDVSGFDTSNVTDMSFMFCSCEKIKSLDVSGFDTSNVTNMSQMFTGCGKLKSLDLSNFNTANVESMYFMFDNCEYLESLDVSSFDTSNVTSMSGIFSRCRRLKSLDISNFDLTNVERTPMFFDSCNGLATLYTPKAMAEGQSIDLCGSFYDSEMNCVNKLTQDICNKILTRSTIEICSEQSELAVGESLQLTVKRDGEILDETTLEEDYTWSYSWYTAEPPIFMPDTGVVKGKGVGTAKVWCVNKEDETVKAFFDITIELPFGDIKTSDWQFKFVKYAYENNLMKGKTEEAFDMNGNLTRTEFVTVLHNYNQKPLPTEVSGFSDVVEGEWYAKPVAWAKEQGITAGNPDGTFGVSENITREQLVVMLYKYAVKCGEAQKGAACADLSIYSDLDEVSTWAVEALTWAVENNILTGKNSDGVYRLDPKGDTARGECAAMMMKYVGLTKE